MNEPTQPLTILHTSDWHLGRTLYGHKRYAEFTAFLDWLADTLEQEQVDVLLVAGDVFDTILPSNRSQELYYRFLCRVAASACRHVVITAGNHDSPTLLNAPRELLKHLNIHVIGHACDTPDDEVLVLGRTPESADLIVCAVPYLRDKEIRTAEAGETIEDKNRKLIDGVRDHYARVAAVAERKRAESGKRIPIVATGHLFTAGGRVAEGDGVRELYVGSLAHITAEAFPATFDYLALGHLHVPQRVGGSATRRYSGSPIPMGFGEATQEKSVCLITFAPDATSAALTSEARTGITTTAITPQTACEPTVKIIPVPRFQELVQITGDLTAIEQKIAELKNAGSNAWLEVIYTGDEVIANLADLLQQAIDGSALQLLRTTIKNRIESTLTRLDLQETLDNLEPVTVFTRLLDGRNIPEDQRATLMTTYQEILTTIHEHDTHAE